MTPVDKIKEAMRRVEKSGRALREDAFEVVATKTADPVWWLNYRGRVSPLDCILWQTTVSGFGPAKDASLELGVAEAWIIGFITDLNPFSCDNLYGDYEQAELGISAAAEIRTWVRTGLP